MKIIIITTVGGGLEIEDHEFENIPLSDILDMLTSAMDSGETFRINRYGISGRNIVGWEVDYEENSDPLSER